VTRSEVFALVVGLSWLIQEIDSHSIEATPTQRAALAGAEQAAQEILDSW
jgi:hypothetical protein